MVVVRLLQRDPPCMCTHVHTQQQRHSLTREMAVVVCLRQLRATNEAEDALARAVRELAPAPHAPHTHTKRQGQQQRNRNMNNIKRFI